MAHHLQLKVTAEGVETAAQLEFLRRHHCDEAQGYLFSAPRPAADIEELLRTDDSVVAALAGGARHPPRRPRRLSRPRGPHSSR
jgi:predicted signal transduction protein with EAL and GGDEF domain